MPKPRGNRRRAQTRIKPTYNKKLQESMSKLKEKITTKKNPKTLVCNEKGDKYLCESDNDKLCKPNSTHDSNELTDKAAITSEVDTLEIENQQLAANPIGGLEADQRVYNETSDDDYSRDSDRDQSYVPSTDDSDESSDTNTIISEVDRMEIENQIAAENPIGDGLEVDQLDLPNAADDEQSLAIENDVETGNKKKRIRQRDFCYYCESMVLNFARHVFRNHSTEFEVQKALSAPKNSKSRKEIITSLRKKGNYIINSQNQSFKPMKKTAYKKNSDYLPCTKCLGFYSRKQLWKHKKTCDNNTSPVTNVQANAQNFLLRNKKVNEKLLTEIFPRMRADKVSMEAKSDNLICAFGLQYLRTHREKHFINVTSRKMRELAKLLIEIKKIKPMVKDLFNALKPQYYETLVLATKNVAKYDSASDRYNSPTYAMNIATSLKQCCNIALMESYKMEARISRGEIQADLRSLIHLIESSWKFDVSSQAADDLNMKKYNKVTIVPLASDLKCLKDFLCTTSTRATTSLAQAENSLNINAYNELLETIFCRVLLLNRRRPGELQRLQLSYYQNYDKKDCENNKYQEFDRVLSATERVLAKTLKRIVIRGKRGRGVPVLFGNDIQKDIDTIISVRNKYVDVNNDFLFAKDGGSLISGYKVIEKYAKLCGAQNPKALTSTRLRKHLATLTQLFNMSENDVEQLASFMGHTMSVHKQNYRLPDDVYQTAKISKLLFLMESGNADMYKGRSLDEINLNLEEEIEGDDVRNEDVLDYEVSFPVMSNETIETLTEPTPSCSNNVLTSNNTTTQATHSCSNSDATIKKKKRTLVPWTPEQKRVVQKYFANHIKSRKPPKRVECEDLRNKHPELLKNKDWLKIKVFIQNIYTKL